MLKQLQDELEAKKTVSKNEHEEKFVDKRVGFTIEQC
jgi:hypothetical protein